MLYSLAAGLVVIVHAAFVAFVVAGGLLVLRWPRVTWIHLPAAAWGALIEFRGRVCPLTPLEQRLWDQAGRHGYDGGFIDHYVVPALYPTGLTRNTQIALGLLVVVINVAVYGVAIVRARRNARIVECVVSERRTEGGSNMAQARGAGERLLHLWKRLSGAPGGRWAYSRLLGWMVPYSGSIRATVLELGPGHARVELRDRRRVRNHLGSIHAIALMNLGELVTGLALNSGLSSSTRAILVGLSMDYRKKARGTLSAECRCEVPEIGQDREVELIGEIRDTSGDTVARARARWRVGPVPRSSE